MLLYSFGSDFDVEDTSQANLDRLKSDVAYANERGIEVGGYDLIALTRRVRDKWAALDEAGNNTGNACFASGWRDHLYTTVGSTRLPADRRKLLQTLFFNADFESVGLHQDVRPGDGWALWRIFLLGQEPPLSRE